MGRTPLEQYGDENKVNEKLRTHPNTGYNQQHTPDKFRGIENQVRMPKPIEASPLKQAMLKMMLSKASMGGLPPKDEDKDEEDWDDTDPTTTGISMDEWAKENMKSVKSTAS